MQQSSDCRPILWEASFVHDKGRLRLPDGLQGQYQPQRRRLPPSGSGSVLASVTAYYRHGDPY
jgi:hypothetical protein